MTIAGWCQVLGKALDEGKFYRELKAKVLQSNASDAQIIKFVKQKAHVTLSKTDIEWLRKDLAGANTSFLDIINAARQAGNLAGGSGRK
jgi:hypothetical protein